MDPITALGIAGSIVQFVDFGIKVVSKGNKIYHSGDGTTAENHDLETVVTDLILIQTRLRQSLIPLDAAGLLNEDDQALVHLSATSNEVASALLERLKKVKAQGRFRRWKSFRQALKSISSKGRHRRVGVSASETARSIRVEDINRPQVFLLSMGTLPEVFN
jgi:hypothetical protein